MNRRGVVVFIVRKLPTSASGRSGCTPKKKRQATCYKLTAYMRRVNVEWQTVFLPNDLISRNVKLRTNWAIHSSIEDSIPGKNWNGLLWEFKDTREFYFLSSTFTFFFCYFASVRNLLRHHPVNSQLNFAVPKWLLLFDFPRLGSLK